MVTYDAGLISSLLFLSFFLYILPDPLASIIGRCTLYTPGFVKVTKAGCTFTILEDG